MGDATELLAAAAAELTVAEAAEAVKLEAAKAAVESEAAAAETEEGGEAHVGVAPTLELEELEVPRGCGFTMKRICLPYPFGIGKI